MPVRKHVRSSKTVLHAQMHPRAQKHPNTADNCQKHALVPSCTEDCLVAPASASKQTSATTHAYERAAHMLAAFAPRMQCMPRVTVCAQAPVA